MMGEQLVTLGAFALVLVAASVRRLERPPARVVPA